VYDVDNELKAVIDARLLAATVLTMKLINPVNHFSRLPFGATFCTTTSGLCYEHVVRLSVCL